MLWRLFAKGLDIAINFGRRIRRAGIQQAYRGQAQQRGNHF
jgi:hypothetical protein